jgi:hypothetical protein
MNRGAPPLKTKGLAAPIDRPENADPIRAPPKELAPPGLARQSGAIEERARKLALIELIACKQLGDSGLRC